MVKCEVCGTVLSNYETERELGCPQCHEWEKEQEQLQEEYRRSVL